MMNSDEKIKHGIGLAVTILIMAIALAGCASNKNEKADSPNALRLNVEDIQPIGIIDPDGNQSIWVISSETRHKLSVRLKKYSVKQMEGLDFYKLTSWKDAYQILSAVTDQQGRILYSMAHELQRIKKQRPRRYRTGRRPTTSISSLEKRIKKLEQLNNGGNP